MNDAPLLTDDRIAERLELLRLRRNMEAIEEMLNICYVPTVGDNMKLDTVQRVGYAAAYYVRSRDR